MSLYPTTLPAWFGCPDPDCCEDPECSNPAHLPDRDDTTWGCAAEEMASWIEDDTRQRRRWTP